MNQCIANLSEAVSRMHGCECSHVKSARVAESMDGQEVWNGQVEVFDLIGHSKASQAFAWVYTDKEGEIHYIAILNVPPINSPLEAVQAAIASGKFA